MFRVRASPFSATCPLELLAFILSSEVDPSRECASCRSSPMPLCGDCFAIWISNLSLCGSDISNRDLPLLATSPLCLPATRTWLQTPLSYISRWTVQIDRSLVSHTVHHNWTMLTCRSGTGRMSHLKDVSRRFKNGFREGTSAPKKVKASAE